MKTYWKVYTACAIVLTVCGAIATAAYVAELCLRYL